MFFSLCKSRSISEQARELEYFLKKQKKNIQRNINIKARKEKEMTENKLDGSERAVVDSTSIIQVGVSGKVNSKNLKSKMPTIQAENDKIIIEINSIRSVKSLFRPQLLETLYTAEEFSSYDIGVLIYCLTSSTDNRYPA